MNEIKLVHIATTPDNAELNVVVRDGELSISVAADADVMTEMRLNEPDWLENKFGAETVADAKRIFAFLAFLLDSPDALTYAASLHKTSGELLEALKNRNKTDRNVLTRILHNAWEMNNLIRSGVWPPLEPEDKWEDE